MTNSPELSLESLEQSIQKSKSMTSVRPFICVPSIRSNIFGGDHCSCIIAGSGVELEVISEDLKTIFELSRAVLMGKESDI